MTFSIAKLNNGTYVAYAKRNLSLNNELLNKIKKEMLTSESRLTSLHNDNITLSKENVKLPTKYSMPNIQNNTLLKQQQLDIILN